MMTQQHLYEWIVHPERLDRDTLYELRTLLARYPYFQTARLLYLKNLYLLHDAAFGEELRKAALYIADRKILFYLIEGDRFVIKPREQEEPKQESPGLDRTLSLIDAFLSAQVEEEVQPGLLPAAPADIPMDIAADYTSYLLKEDTVAESEAVSPMKGQDLIDGFLEKNSVAEDPEPVPAPAAADEDADEAEDVEEAEEKEEDMEEESYFTETLAKIYVKQQRYSKALEIIKKLNLKYPKKNAYFADQIRFLEKLIINAKSK